jgi:hypothetical protein
VFKITFFETNRYTLKVTSFSEWAKKWLGPFALPFLLYRKRYFLYNKKSQRLRILSAFV